MFPKMFAVAFLFLSLFTQSQSFAAQTVDINNDDAATIAENLNGIGEAKARAIVAYRSEHGGFSDEQDLIKVKGIGAKLVERNRSLISFGKKAGAAKPVVAAKKSDQTSAKAGVKNTNAAAAATGQEPQPQLSN